MTKTIKRPLTASELHTLEQISITTTRLQTVRDIFVFQCYTGLAYIDANLFPVEATRQSFFMSFITQLNLFFFENSIVNFSPFFHKLKLRLLFLTFYEGKISMPKYLKNKYIEYQAYLYVLNSELRLVSMPKILYYFHRRNL